MNPRLISLSSIFPALLAIFREPQMKIVSAYPMIAHVDEESERCFRFNIRDHDDAHLIMVALPSEEQYPDKSANWNELESWFVSQLYEISQKKSAHHGLASQLADAPDLIAQKMNDFRKDNAAHHDHSPITIRLTGNPSAESPDYQGTFHSRYFTPHTVNHLKRFLQGKHPRPRSSEERVDHLEGYGLCFKSNYADHVTHVVFDIVLNSDGPTDPRIIQDKQTATKTTDFDKTKHLTPLERSLDQSIAAANAVLREMKHMEKREQRMRQTSDHINQRVRWFSYLSIAVLLFVTYVQVGYLKRYFRKKKLL